MGLAEEVLALHDAIDEVLIVEDRAGDVHVVDRAQRNGPSVFEAMKDGGKDSMFGPTLILGAATQVGNAQKSGQLRLVAMQYAQLGVVCVPIDDNSYLMAKTSNEYLLEVMKAVGEALPHMTRRRPTSPETLALDSALDADRAVRSFFASTNLCEPNHIHIDHAILNTNDQCWQVAGSYRPAHAIRSKRYQIELDARTGAVTKFETRAS